MHVCEWYVSTQVTIMVNCTPVQRHLVHVHGRHLFVVDKLGAIERPPFIQGQAVNLLECSKVTISVVA